MTHPLFFLSAGPEYSVVEETEEDGSVVEDTEKELDEGEKVASKGVEDGTEDNPKVEMERMELEIATRSSMEEEMEGESKDAGKIQSIEGQDKERGRLENEESEDRVKGGTETEGGQMEVCVGGEAGVKVSSEAREEVEGDTEKETADVGNGEKLEGGGTEDAKMEGYQKVEFAVLYYHTETGYYYDPVS